MSKPTITICIDYDLMPVVKELQSRRKFSAFIQDSLRQHKSIIEAESLEHERDKVEQELQSLLAKKASIETKLKDIVVEEVLTPGGIQSRTDSYLGSLYGTSSNSKWSNIS